ncbi:MAG: uroporphyrinogen-III synthase [Acidobacteria bacterium]|jgi:uroporphyrinogen-III synthase|nr:uroporphyrinogen-III synthase [Acidobacteriota bacterium]
MSNSAVEKNYALFDTPPNQKLISALSGKGANIILFPFVETKKITLSAESILFLKNLTSFDWIIFPDVFTVEFFLQNLDELGIDLFELDAVNVCVFGESIADKLRFVQLHADVIADFNDESEVFQTLSNYLSNEFQNLNIILAKEVSFEYEIKNELTKRGARVEELSLYSAKSSRQSNLVKLKTLLKGGAIDEFIFSSEEDMEALRHYFAGESVTEVLKEIKISTVSQSVFQTLKENNLRPEIFHPGKK